jgi:Na+/H+ antiporter NhaD/arsenite permease-like protein
LNTSVLAGLIFVSTYAALVSFRRVKSQILWGGVLLGLAFGLIHTGDVFQDINWNVMGIFAGVLLLSEFFILSHVPDAISVILIQRSRTVGTAYLLVCVFSSVLSIFIENIATVLIIAPIMIILAKRLRVSPVPGVIGIAIASNLQGTATLIGDPPSMILASYMHMNFNDFFFYQGKPGIFFAVQSGAIGSMLFLYWLYRKYKTPIEFGGTVAIRSLVPTIYIILMIICLSLSTFVDPEFKWFGGFICMFLAFLCALTSRFAPTKERLEVLRRFDWSTTAFLAGIFVMVGMLERAGVLENVANFLVRYLGTQPIVAFTVIVWASVAFSAFIDNVPYLTALIPVVQLLADKLGVDVALLVFGLLIGACLGGNITPIGASANIVGVGALRKENYHVSFWEFARVGLPFTVLATLLGSTFIYFVWR